MEKNAQIENADVWETRYQENSTRWERGQINAALRHWLDSKALDAGRILIPGCGRSPEPFLLAELDFEVTALDFAPSPIEHQNKLREGHKAKDRLHFEQADVLAWQAPAPFDAVYEQTCLCALNPGQWADYVAQLRAWLRPGGKLFALFMQTGREGGPPYHCSLEAMQALFPAHDWIWEEQGQYTSDHSNDKAEIGTILTRI
jgi:cyclopropane fatty-acyl-phospholipid synthase-like methyltransferase